MDSKKYTLIGNKLTEDEALAFPEGIRFTADQTAVWLSHTAEDVLRDASVHHIDRLSLLLMSSIRVQCPVGPHDDLGLDIAIFRACNVAKAGSVAIQCSQGHWAEYPCG